MMSPVLESRPLSTFVLLVALAGCGPSPDVLRAGAGRELWNTGATKSPPPPDADEIVDDPPSVEGDAGNPEPMADAQREPADTRGPALARDSSSADTPPAVTGPPQTCALTFQVTTANGGGNYAPRNCGAIWVTDANGRFVKSLNVWAQKRIRHLVTWQASAMGNTVDAVTSATINSHGTRMAKWNCTGVDRQPVPDGTYRINAEMTERNGLGKVMTPLVFVKGPAPFSAVPADQSSFKNVRLEVTTP